jgi:DNA-binding NarL/FixJ family response regulator
MKILVVDDHPLIRQALRGVLKELDSALEVVEAEAGDQALEQADLNPDLDLILLDLTLPGLDGFCVLTELRQRHAGIPVAVLSATDDRETVLRAIDAGAMGYIPKTSRSDILLAALRLVFAGSVYLPPTVVSGGSQPQLLARSGQPAPESSERNPSKPTDIGLTERQAEVLSLLVQGKPNKLICRELNLAEGTVKVHISAILKALNVHNRTEAVVAVGNLGLKLEALGAGRSGSVR